MSPNSNNPLNMIPDPFSGDTFVLPKTDCTSERILFFKRMNEIQSLLYVAKQSFDVCKKNYEENITPKLPAKEKTFMKLVMNGGNYISLPAARIIEILSNGINIFTRQAFIMFYGSFETYLYQLFERSFPLIGVTEEILEKSRVILTRNNWDGKFCKMNEEFDVGYKAGDLVNCFNSFEMDFEGTKHKNPLHFLSELAQVRHRIVHASSILENDRLIFIHMNTFHGLFSFFFRLTDYVDNLFAKRFDYDRKEMYPGEV